VGRLLGRAGAASLALTLTLLATTVGIASGATGPSTTWRLIYRTHYKAATIMTGVTAHDSRHAWAIGWAGNYGFVLQWNGKSWRKMPPLPSGFTPVAIAASSPTNVWVFSQTLVDGVTGIQATQWDSHKWTLEAMPAESLGDGVAATSSPTDTWYSDGQEMLHWNGSVWTTQATPTPVGLGNGPTGQIWQVVAGRVAGHEDRLIARRWNGNSWEWVHLPHLAVTPNNDGAAWYLTVSIASASNIAITVPTATIRDDRKIMHVLFWNGKHWRTSTIPYYGYDHAVAAGRDLAWAGSNALWNGQHWINGGPALPANDLAGVPGTSATWTAGFGPSGHSQDVGWIWLNGKL
jgi:hypothetical protein